VSAAERAVADCLEHLRDHAAHEDRHVVPILAELAPAVAAFMAAEHPELERASIEGRADDTPKAIATRLATYHAETEPVVEHYRATGRLVPLHAERSIEEVWTEISDSLQVVT